MSDYVDYYFNDDIQVYKYDLYKKKIEESSIGKNIYLIGFVNYKQEFDFEKYNYYIIIKNNIII